MWKKKDQPEREPPMSDADRELLEQCGDAGGPVSEVDPDAAAERSRADEREARLLAEIEEWKGKYTRALADFRNYQRRALENEEEARKQGAISVVRSLLGVLDHFDLALKHDADSASAEQIIKGVGIIRSQLTQALASVGVSAIEPKSGEMFDPHRHEAVAHLPAPGVEPGRVASMLQTGYALGERVLRPAKVAVAKEPDQPRPENEQAG